MHPYEMIMEELLHSLKTKGNMMHIKRHVYVDPMSLGHRDQWGFVFQGSVHSKLTQIMSVFKRT